MAEKTACVILNYNVASLTIRLAETLAGYSSVSDIIIVDNCSTDDSRESLLKIESCKIHIVYSDKNGGYGYGNNIGVRTAYEKYGAKYVLILNPDVEVEENVIAELRTRFEKNPELAIASARQITPIGDNAISCWKIESAFFHTIEALPLSIKLYRKCKKDGGIEDQFSEHETECVSGSLLMTDAEKFIEVGGYDEQFFLYMEENILGCRMKQRGYKTLYCGNITYFHNHGVSTIKTFKRESKTLDLLRDSKVKYLRNYLGATELQILLFKILSEIGKTEVVLWHGIKSKI